MGIRRAAIQTTADRTVSYQSGQSTNGTISSGGGGTLVTSIVYTDNNYNTLTANAAATTFGTFRILGTGFANGANVMLANTSAGTIANVTTNTSYVSSGEIRANVSVTAGNYTLYVLNPNGSAAIYYSGILFEPYPQWTTTSYTSSGIVNLQLLTSSTAVEQPITYALVSGTLPTGASLSANGLISGTVTQSNTVQSYTFTVSATDIYNESTQASITLTIALADLYFNQTTLLLNGETNTNTYIQDASTNNFALTVTGAATPNRFSPLWGTGYYGVGFTGSSTSLSAGTSSSFAFGTNSFTVEFWVNISAYNSSYTSLISTRNGGSTGFDVQIFNNSGTYQLMIGNPSGAIISVNSVTSLNTWLHIAAVRSGSTMYLFVNGSQVASGTSSYNFTETNFYIGAGSGGTINEWAGYISNLRVLNGTGLYTSSFTPSTTPLTTTSQGATNCILLTCQNANFLDNSTNAYTISPTGTVKVASNQPFGALPSNVQSYGSSLFDGSTGYLTYTGGTSQQFGTNNFTVECWIYPTVAPGTNGMYIIDARDSTHTGNWAFYFGSVSGITWLWNSSAVVSNSTTYSANTWYHVAYVRNGSVGTIYVNGVSAATGTDSNNYNILANTSYIGTRYTQANFAQGYITNFRIVNGTAVYTTNFTPPTTPLTAITNTSLLTLQYKNGANNNVFYDDSVNNFAITRTGTPTQGTFTPFSQTGWSNYFDGSSGYLTIPSSSQLNLSGATAWTLEAWIYWNGSNSQAGIIEKDGVSGSSYASYGIQLGGSGYVALILGSGNGTSSQQFMASTVLCPVNQWTHIAATLNAGTLYLYQNGAQVASATKTATITDGGKAVYIGYEQGQVAANFFGGYISNVRVVNGTAVYTSAFTPSTVPLTAIANTVLLTCQSNRFLDSSSNAATLTPNGTVQAQAFSPFAPGVTYSTANNSGSIYFNGSSDYLLVSQSNAPLLSGNFTAEAWVYPTTISGSQCLVGTANWEFYFTNGVLAFVYQSVQGYTSTLTLVPNQWNHITFCRSGSTQYFGLNGVVQSQAGSSTTPAASPMTVGCSYYASSPRYYFPGYISNFRFTNSQALYTASYTVPTAPLLPTSNSALMLSATNTGIQDATGKNDIITVGSTMTQSNTVKYGSGAMYFNGAGNYLLTPAPANPLVCSFGGSFTIEMWVYLTSTGNQYPIFSGYGSSNSQGGVQISIASGTATGSIYIGSTAYNATNSTSIAQTTWTHLALVRNGSTLTLYVNGVGGTGVSASGATNYSSSFNFYVGQNYSTSYPFTGYIDDLRVTNGVARYTSNFTPATSADLTQ